MYYIHPSKRKNKQTVQWELWTRRKDKLGKESYQWTGAWWGGLEQGRRGGCWCKAGSAHDSPKVKTGCRIHRVPNKKSVSTSADCSKEGRRREWSPRRALWVENENILKLSGIGMSYLSSECNLPAFILFCTCVYTGWPSDDIRHMSGGASLHIATTPWKI